MNLAPMIVLLAAVCGCTADGPAAFHEGWRLARLGSRFGRKVLARARAAAPSCRTPRLPCRAELERRERQGRDFLAFDVFRNSTEYEEYRPS